MRDNLFDKKIDIADFRFDKEVVKVLMTWSEGQSQDMIQ